MRMVLIGLGAVLAATATTPTFAFQFDGEDRPTAQCAAKDSDKNTTTSGHCGTVCKGKEIKTATGEDQKSGYQYTCNKAAEAARNDDDTGKWGLLGLLGLLGFLGLRPRRDRDDSVGSDRAA